jgi:hypothetical protein
MPSLSSGFLIGKGLGSLQGGFDKLKQGVDLGNAKRLASTERVEKGLRQI